MRMKPICTLLISTLISFAVSAQNTFWSLIPEASITVAGERVIVPDAYATCSLSLEQYKSYFAAAPIEFTPAAAGNPLLIELPMPDKTMAKFKVWESPVMAPGLATQLPGIKTYTGQGLDNPAATVKIDFTYRGFHAMVLSPEGNVFIDPYYKNSFDHYLSYYAKNFNPPGKPRSICKGLKNPHPPAAPNGIQAGNGTQLRTYRLAVACTGEYAVFFGGTLTAASSAIATTINRVNGVYEKEVAVRLVLVANNNNIVFTNPATDPFDGNDNSNVLINESQAEIDNIITDANYDIGHTFSTGAGGLAGLGVVCSTGDKASGVTGSSSPVGDPYDIDYVAHEIGHQFDGDHSFNGTAGFCDGNRNAATAYEVGSGTTIMGYAGICDFHDVQPNSDAFFHTVSFDQITNFINFGGGSVCPVTTATGNDFPTVNTGTGAFTIPKGTPFTLTGSAADLNGDVLTYYWEQFNLGLQGLNSATSTSGPNFRNYVPVTSPTRTFPRIQDIASNATTFRELLYDGATDRGFNFRLTARDNRAAGGGVNYAPLAFTVSGSSGPFTVTAPNTAVSWLGSSSQTITWNVSGSDAAPVSCSNVRITLSTDGGITYPTVLLTSTPNDGSEAITVPNTVTTTTARVRVECVFSNYSFFDISNTNFTINPTVPVSLVNFTAQIQKEKVVARWQTTQESNSSSFVVERSANGTDFTTIGSIAAAGNSVITKNYAFNDNNPLSGTSFYRLKLTDRDGSYKYSGVVTVKFAPVFDLQLAPNPAKENLRITGKALAGNATLLEIFNSNGQRLFSRSYRNVETISEVINTAALPGGIYRVKISGGTQMLHKKLVIVH